MGHISHEAKVICCMYWIRTGFCYMRTDASASPNAQLRDLQPGGATIRARLRITMICVTRASRLVEATTAPYVRSSAVYFSLTRDQLRLVSSVVDRPEARRRSVRTMLSCESHQQWFFSSCPFKDPLVRSFRWKTGFGRGPVTLVNDAGFLSAADLLYACTAPVARLRTLQLRPST